MRAGIFGCEHGSPVVSGNLRGSAYLGGRGTAVQTLHRVCAFDPEARRVEIRSNRWDENVAAHGEQFSQHPDSEAPPVVSIITRTSAVLTTEDSAIWWHVILRFPFPGARSRKILEWSSAQDWWDYRLIQACHAHRATLHEWDRWHTYRRGAFTIAGIDCAGVMRCGALP